MTTAVPLTRLQDVAELNPALDAIPSPDDLVSFLPMSALDADQVDAVERETRQYHEVRKGYTPFVSNDVLVAKITPCFENGKIAQAKPTHRIGFGSTEFHVIRSRPDKLEPRYLVHFLRQERVRKDGELRMTGSAGQRRIPEHFLANLQVPLPPLPEQRRIAAILDKADALRTKRRAALAKLDILRRSIFLDMFGDPATNTKRWPRQKIANVGRVVTGNTPSRTNPLYYGDAIEWIKSDNINTPDYYVTRAEEGLSDLGRQVARVVPAGSILVTCIAGSPDVIGNSAMTDREVAFNQQINAIVPIDGNEHFIYGLLCAGKRLIQEASSAAMKGMVSKSRFEQIALIWPPHELQNEFAERVLAVERAITQQGASLDKLERLFASLQHRAFRAEL